MASRRKSALSRASSSHTSDEATTDPYSAAFDPATFKVVELRALLHKHNIVLPSNARKADLIRAYEEDIRPQLDDLRAARNRDLNIRPKVEPDVLINGIDRGAESSGYESDINGPRSALSQPGTPRRKRRSVSWAEDVSGPEDEGVDGDASTFSINNPFQSPRLAPSKPTGARKSEPAARAEPSSAKGKQPRTSTPNALRSYMNPSIKSSGPLPAVKKEDADESGMDADLSRDAYSDPPSSPLSQKYNRSGKSGSKLSQSNVMTEGKEDDSNTARSIFWTLLIGLTASWWLWYVSESKAVGFCDVGRHSNALLDAREMERLASENALQEDSEDANITMRMPDFLRPSCAPCPPHAQCRGGALLGCESSDYVLHTTLLSHLLVIQHVSPLSWTTPICRPDEQKVLLAADLADEMESRLRTWKGHVQCKRRPARFASKSSDQSPLGQSIIYALPKDKLQQELREEAQRSSVLVDHPPEYFDELWNLALEDLHANDRIGEEHRGQAVLFSKRAALGVGLGCRAKLVVDSAWRRMRLWVALLSAMLAVVQWLRYRVHHTRHRAGKTKELVAATLARLEGAKRESSSSTSAHNTEGGYLSISQLRDDILRDESSEKRKKVLWASVSKIVEANTNVRTRQAKVKGEWSRVWEWVGMIDHGLAKGRMKKSGGSSMDADTNESDEVVNMGKNRLHSVEV